MRPNMPTFIVIISVSIGVITFSVSAFGQCAEYDYYWVAGAGDWSTPDNWRHEKWNPDLQECVLVPGVPTDGNYVHIGAGEPYVSVPGVTCYELDIDSCLNIVTGGSLSCRSANIGSFGAGIIKQTGGTNSVGYFDMGRYLSSSGTYELSDGILSAAMFEVVGCEGTGLFRQTGGTNIIFASLCLGQYPTGSGTYYLSDGDLSANNESIGYRGSGAFVQNGGTNTIESTLNVGGRYELLGGTLNVQVNVDVDGFFVVNGGVINGGGPNAAIGVVSGGSLTGPGTFNIIVVYESDRFDGPGFYYGSVGIVFERNCLTKGGAYNVKQLTPADFAGGNVPNLLKSSVFDVSFDGSFCGEFTITIPYARSEVYALDVKETSLVILHETGPGKCERLENVVVDELKHIVSAKARTFGKFAVAVPTVAVVELEALNDIPICDDNGNPIESIWRKEFDDSGTLVDSNPPEDHSVVSSMTSGGFKMRARLAGWPINPGFVPNLKCRWAVGNLSQETDFDIRNPGELIYESKHYIRVPQSVGKYTLALHFSIYKEDTWIADCPPIYRTLYVMFDDPSRNEIDINVQRPKEKWMEEVTHWAAGARDRGSVLQMIVDGIYYWARDHGWIYVPGESQSSTHWVDLIDGSSTRANCVPMASLWEKAARILGVKNVATTWTKGKPTSGDCGEAEENAPGFLTIKAAAFDVTAKGNASEWLGSDPDRWLFESHYVGKTCGWFGLFPTYYDPTLGETWQRLSQFIKCCVLTSEWYTDPVSRYPRKDLEGGAYIVDYNTPAIGHRLVYHGLTGESTLQDVQHMFTRTEDATVTFTGGCSAFGSDDNNDSRFDRLVTISEVTASAPTEFRVFGVVTCGTTFVTQRASKNSTMQTSVTVAGQMGLNTVELSFSGFDINSSETDGPYTVTLYLCDTSGSLVDQVEFLTDPYEAAQFGETSAQIVRVSDSAMDVDGDALFDSLVIATDISIFREGLYYLSTSLVDSNGLFITSSDANAYLPVGIHKVDVAFDCREINKSAEVNTYLVEMTVFSADGEQQDDTSFVTSAYQPNTFERKAVLISSSCSDYGVDSDGDGLFDFLRLEVGFDVAETNSYSITAWLQDPNGTDITFAEVYMWLDQGRQTVAVDFAGSAIWTVGLDGPYSVIYLLIRNDDRIVDAIRNLHTTSGYIHSQFDANILTDFTGDNKVDFRDFAKLALYWLQYDPSSDVFPPISGDGIVNVLDLAVVAEHWLEGTTP